MLLGEAQVQNGDMEGSAPLDEVIKLAGLQSEAGKSLSGKALHPP